MAARELWLEHAREWGEEKDSFGCERCRVFEGWGMFDVMGGCCWGFWVVGGGRGRRGEGLERNTLDGNEG